MSDKEQKKAALLAEVERNMGSDNYAKLDEATKEKLVDAFLDEAFVKKLFSLEEPEDVQAAFKEKGLNYTIEEIKGMRDGIINDSHDGELSDEQMMQATGGSVTAIAGIAICAFIGGIASGIVEEAVEDAYNAVKKKWRW